MKYFILFLALCFLMAYFSLDRKPKWRYTLLFLLAVLLCVSYYFRGRL